MKYRKKPIVIEAVQVLNVDYSPGGFDGCPFSEGPEWLKEAIRIGIVTPHPQDTDYTPWDIKTLEGTMLADAGDYIIQGIQGELYPCKADIFLATYERVVD